MAFRIKLNLVRYNGINNYFKPLNHHQYQDDEKITFLDFEDIYLAYCQLPSVEAKAEFLDTLIEGGLEAELKLSHPILRPKESKDN